MFEIKIASRERIIKGVASTSPEMLPIKMLGRLKLLSKILSLEVILVSNFYKLHYSLVSTVKCSKDSDLGSYHPGVL